MYCKNCGNYMTEDSLFCTCCGKDLVRESDKRIIKLQCKNCNGFMNIDAKEKEISCPYCGYKERILDSDMVIIEKIRSDTYKEMEYAKIEHEKQRLEMKDLKEAQMAYRDDVWSGITFIMIFVCTIAMFLSFGSTHFVKGLVALIQLFLFGLSWLQGMRIVKVNRVFSYYFLAAVGFLLIIPFLLIDY